MLIGRFFYINTLYPLTMGASSLYKWVTMKYSPIRTFLHAENNYHVDNLYLDFNAIIHPCCDKESNNLHDLDLSLYKYLEEYVDLLMNICKPKGLLYIGIDGVAPMAKINQQRGRRYEIAKEKY